jgi:3-oxoacyl-[acyl-carrier protein] reductase
MTFRLDGSVAVVTGGSRGIGAATARLFAASGAKVAVVGRDRDAIDAVVWDIGSQALGVVADCTDFAAIEAMRVRVEADLGPVDVLAAFAGAALARPQVPVHLTTEEEWRASVEGNLTATFLTLKSFLPGMIERRRGSIVTMASTAARISGGGPAPYAAAKAGIMMLTRQVATENGQFGVRANCVSPSAILTERNEALIPSETRSRIADMHPLHRMGTPQDVAASALFLASPASSWLTGLIIDVAGGRVMP